MDSGRHVYVRVTNWKGRPPHVSVFARLDDAMDNMTDAWAQATDGSGAKYNWMWEWQEKRADVLSKVITKERVIE